MGEWLQEFIHEAPAHDFPIFAPYYELTQEQKIIYGMDLEIRPV